ncbi:MAG: sugar nucleotide-binding protein, partial [Deltaproteobacteria bacterium]|nr:sugar nucleotide-binding protein [Deltaproteobacteria bacterium]
MKLLVIGSNGQLGWEICRQGMERGFEIIPLDFPEIDITSKVNLDEKISPVDFDILINCAAYTAVDKAESEKDLAYAVNLDGPAFLAEICAEKNVPLVHVSTDYVFSGNKDGCNMETDLVEPLGVYGKSKAEGEDRVR